jgi:hypothetical protein
MCVGDIYYLLAGLAASDPSHLEGPIANHGIATPPAATA